MCVCVGGGYSITSAPTLHAAQAPKIFSGDIKTHFLLFADESGAEIEQFRATASAEAGRVLFVRVPSSEERVMGFFGFDASSIPAAVIVHMDDAGMKKFKYTGAFESAAFAAFINDYEA